MWSLFMISTSGLFAPRARASLAAAFLSCTTLAACSGIAEPTGLGPVPDGAFTTDATGYVAQRLEGSANRYHFTVISRFENRGTVPLFLGRCLPTSSQPLFSVIVADSSSAESGYAQIWACVGHDQQFEITPGGVRVDTLQITGPNVFPSGSSTGVGITSGKFQLYFDVRLTRGDGGTSAPAAVRGSNAFLVRTSG